MPRGFLRFGGDCVVELVGLEPTTKVLWNMVGVRPAPLVGHLSRSPGVLTVLLDFPGFLILEPGKTVGGVPFTRGGMSYLLRNRFYLGEVAFKGEVLPGEQLAILDRELFDAVQVKLSEQKNNHQTLRTSSNALLMGRLFDDRGNGMTPSHTCKQGVRYRYYLSSGLLQGQAERPGSVHRVAATEIENVVIQSVRDHVKPPEAVEDRGLVEAYVERVEIRPDRLIVRLNQTDAADGSQPEGTNTLHIPWSKTPPTRRREILLPADPSQQRPRPIQSATKATLIAAIVQGRRWLKELIYDPAATTESIATGAQCSVRKVNMTISLAFLAPDLVKAAIDGRTAWGSRACVICPSNGRDNTKPSDLLPINPSGPPVDSQFIPLSSARSHPRPPGSPQSGSLFPGKGIFG